VTVEREEELVEVDMGKIGPDMIYIVWRGEEVVELE